MTFPVVGELPARAGRTTERTQQVAWSVILFAFALFCVVCVVTGIGINYFLFQSTMSMPAYLVIGRGTAGLTGTDGNVLAVTGDDENELLNTATISTDRQSQATLDFLDPLVDNHLVASVTIKNDSEITLRTVSRPRFEWSSVEYRIRLDEARGAFDVFIPESGGRAIRFMMGGRGGATVYLTESGRYTVRVTDAEMRVDNLEGEAVVINPQDRSFPIPPGQRCVLNFAQPQCIITPSYTDLLRNSTFQQTNIAPVNTATVSDALRELPLEWGCTDEPNDAPSGAYGMNTIDGRRAMHLVRGDNANSHGETGCQQIFAPLNAPGIDISAYQYVSLRTTFQIRGQSLSACGELGSECPLALEIGYVDVNGAAKIWNHGFYTTNFQIGYPLRCSSCAQEHDGINANTWYTYDSGNFFTLIPPAESPRSIRYIEFYASGHQYDVHVGQVSLLVGNNEGVIETSAPIGG